MKKPTLLLTALILAGCTSTTIKPMATEPDLVSARIAQAAEKASKSLDAIADIEKNRATSLPPPEDYSLAPPNLKQLVTIRWTGPMEQIVRTLADRSQMQLRIRGSQPPVPLTVTVDVYQKPVIEVFRDVGLQVGQRADLSVDGQGGTVEISYAPVDKI